MALFIVVIIHDLGKVFFKVFRPCIIRGCITFSSRNTKTRVFLLVLFFSKPFFDIFQAFLKVFVLLKELFASFSS